MYNFYIFLIVDVVLKVFILNLKQDILKKLTIFEELFISNILLFFIFFLFFICRNGPQGILRVFRKVDTLDKKTITKMITFVIFVAFAVLFGSFILKNENISKYQIFKQSLYIITVFLFGYLLKKFKFNTEIILGIILVLTGLYFVDKQFKLQT